MPEIKVWLGGEGSCELGTRADSGDSVGVVEALLRKLEPLGWHVEGATKWQHIRKFRVGAARAGGGHGDTHNARALALIAFEAGCEVLAFVRDVDADTERAAAIARGIADTRIDYPMVRIVGGCARPAIEGWILALSGVSNSDDMSRARTLDELRARAVDEKSHLAYVAVIDAASLEAVPNGCESLTTWLDNARTELRAAVHGTST